MILESDCDLLGTVNKVLNDLSMDLQMTDQIFSFLGNRILARAGSTILEEIL